MTTPAEVLGDAHTAAARIQRSRTLRYLNRDVAPGARGAWLSEVGFYVDLPFSYGVADTSNYHAPDGEGRNVEAISIELYGLARDAARFASTEAADNFVRSARAPFTRGLAPFPGLAGHYGIADLGDSGDLDEKTSGLLASMRTAGSGVTYHAIVTRRGAVYVCAPCDGSIPSAAAGASSVAVAVEAALVRPISGGALVDAPPSGAQLRSLVALIAKLRVAYPGVALQYAVRPNETASLAGQSPWYDRPENSAVLPALLAAEPGLDLATQVFRESPPPASRRAEAQVVLGTVDTLGAASLVLGAYTDLAAQDRASALQESPRTHLFVARARAAVATAEAHGATAAQVNRVSATAPVIAPATGSAPWVYDYATGRWGDE